MVAPELTSSEKMEIVVVGYPLGVEYPLEVADPGLTNFEGMEILEVEYSRDAEAPMDTNRASCRWTKLGVHRTRCLQERADSAKSILRWAEETTTRFLPTARVQVV